MTNLTEFLSILFRPGESTCYSKHARGTSIFPADRPPTWVQFFSINPHDGKEDHDPYEDYHSPDRPRRADANVTAFRNILIELDKMPLEEQMPYIDAAGVPWSTCVYSGSKSMHFIIALEEGYPTQAEYDHVVYWMHSILLSADHSTKNPSRLSRFPGVIRVDKNKEQTLVEVRGRVTKEQLQEWLNKYPEAEPVKYDKTITNGALPEGELGFISKRTQDFLMYGAESGERNTTLHRAARDLHQQGWTEEAAIPVLLEPLLTTSDYDEKKCLQTISSAFRKAPRHPPRLSTGRLFAK